MFRFLSILLLAATVRGCASYEFEQEFWTRTDGSGSFRVTAPPWVWNCIKNVGDANRLEGTVNEITVGALFQDPAIIDPRVKKFSRDGRTYITASADFSDINALVGTKAFPDLVVALRREGQRLRLFGVWRRPQLSGTARGEDAGLMAVRFHIPSEIYEHRNASLGVERGNVLSWKQDLRGAIAGAPLDFGATLGTENVLTATPGVVALAISIGLGLVALLFLMVGRGRKKRGPPRRPSSQEGSTDPSNFLNYDPGSGVK